MWQGTLIEDFSLGNILTLTKQLAYKTANPTHCRNMVAGLRKCQNLNSVFIQPDARVLSPPSSGQGVLVPPGKPTEPRIHYTGQGSTVYLRHPTLNDKSALQNDYYFGDPGPDHILSGNEVYCLKLLTCFVELVRPANLLASCSERSVPAKIGMNELGCLQAYKR